MLLNSCSKEIDYELNFEGEKIVVNSFFSSNDGFEAFVSKTASPNGTVIFDSLKLNDAIIIVYENDIPFDTLQSLGEGHYQGNKYPSMGNRYALSVAHSEFETATASNQELPLDFEMNISDKRINHVLPKNEDFPTLDFNLSITDAAAERNYYFIKAYLIIDGSVRSNFNFWLPNQSEFAADPCQTDEFFFPDDCFNGQELLLNMAMETQTLDEEKAQQVEVVVKSISKDFYEYLKSNRPQPEGFEVPFTEPNFLFTNIKNGYGIFAGFSENRVIIDL